MPINFHDQSNRHTYASRNASPKWHKTITSIVQTKGKTVLDVGCGGGIYTRAWASLGAKTVIGVDFSEAMIQTAREHSEDYTNIRYQVGHAANTNLPARSADIVFQRALIHHLSDLTPCMAETWRVLKPGGLYLIQDRTPEDVSLPGTPEHIRGYFFEIYPQLLEIEKARRHKDAAVQKQLHQANFIQIKSRIFWELRQIHPTLEHLAGDIRNRTGRSILHDLTDAEIESLIEFISVRVPASAEIHEKDRWTIWTAQKPN